MIAQGELNKTFYNSAKQANKQKKERFTSIRSVWGFYRIRFYEF